MTSNAPTTDGQTPSFTLNSPPLIRHIPASIGIVSQSQETTVSQSLHEHSPTTHFDLLLQAHEEIDGIVQQTPLRDVSAVTTISTPVIASPTKEERLEMVRKNLFSLDAERISASELKRKNLIKNLKNTTRRCGNPATTILWYLRKRKLEVSRKSPGFQGNEIIVK
jgi:hypothetical protein